MSVRSFAATSASKMGVSERTVFRLLAAGQALGPREIQELRDAPKKVSLSDLQEIAKCGSPTDRYDICRALGDGSAKSAKEVLARKKAPGTAIKDPVEAARGKLNDAKPFSSIDHTKAWRLFKVRPKVGRPQPNNTDKKYCLYHPAHGDYTYSGEWIKMLTEAAIDEVRMAAIGAVKL